VGVRLSTCRRNRICGPLLLVVTVALIATGYAVYLPLVFLVAVFTLHVHD